jgi:hypothetical protein
MAPILDLPLYWKVKDGFVSLRSDRGRLVTVWRCNDGKGVLGMAWHGFLMKAAPTVVTGVVGVAAYEAVRTAVAKVPLRTATVAVTAWGIRAAREAQRTAETNTEQVRLTVADVVAEAREHAGEDVKPVTVTCSGDDDHDH